MIITAKPHTSQPNGTVIFPSFTVNLNQALPNPARSIRTRSQHPTVRVRTVLALCGKDHLHLNFLAKGCSYLNLSARNH